MVTYVVVAAAGAVGRGWRSVLWKRYSKSGPTAHLVWASSYWWSFRESSVLLGNRTTHAEGCAEGPLFIRCFHTTGAVVTGKREIYDVGRKKAISFVICTSWGNRGRLLDWLSRQPAGQTQAGRHGGGCRLIRKCVGSLLSQRQIHSSMFDALSAAAPSVYDL